MVRIKGKGLGLKFRVMVIVMFPTFAELRNTLDITSNKTDSEKFLTELEMGGGGERVKAITRTASAVKKT